VVKPTSVTVSGAVNGHGTATSWYFQYGPATNPAYGSKTATLVLGAGKGDVSVVSVLSGLAAATSYHYRLVATNGTATTDGVDGVFNTSAAPAVITGAATLVTSSSATLKATVNPEALATTWYFQYGPTTKYGSKTSIKSLPAGPNPTTVTAAVSGLAPHATYHFRIVGSSSAGTSLGADLPVTTDLSVSLNPSIPAVVEGGFVALSGVVASGKGGKQVTIMSEAYGQSSYSGIAAVTTKSGGAWSYSAQPTVRTTYEVSANGGASSPIVVSVSPAVFLTVNHSGTLTTRVVGTPTFAGHVLQLQRLTRGLWVTWKHVLLDSTGRATFSTSLPGGRTLVRMAIGPFVPGINQAGPGYVAGYSRPATYVGK
jgi:hypothetical protein